MRHRLAIFISGSGTTMEAIVKAKQSGEVDIDISCIISNSEDVKGRERARNLHIPLEDNLVVNPKDAISILEILQKRKVTVIMLSGWMFLIPKIIIDAYGDRIFNQHPGPVPEFGGKGMYGIRVHTARLFFARRVKRDFWTQAIIQKVDYKYDEGDVVASQKINIGADDTPESLQKRVLPIEHSLQIKLLKKFARGQDLKSIKRKPLVLPGEEFMLEQAKQNAIKIYPK